MDLDPVVCALRECGVPLQQMAERNSLSMLHRAVALGRLDALGELRGDVHTRDALGQTPLHYAVLLGSLDAVRDLLELGADPNAADHTLNAYTPLHLACKAAWNDAVGELFRFRDLQVNKASGRHGTALHLALRVHAVQIAEKLVVAGGADVNAADGTGLRPLHVLALELLCNGKSEELQKLLGLLCEARGAGELQVNAVDAEGRTPLHCAALTGNRMVAEALLTQLKADPHARDQLGRTPLHLAVLGLCVGSDSGLGSSIKALLAAGAPLLARDRRGLTALDTLKIVQRSRNWRKGEATAISVAALQLTKAEEDVARAAQAEAMAKELIADEEQLASRKKPGTNKKTSG